MGFPGAQAIKRLLTMWETQVRSLGWEDPLEKEMATHSSTLASRSRLWAILWRSLMGYNPLRYCFPNCLHHFTFH